MQKLKKALLILGVALTLLWVVGIVSVVYLFGEPIQSQDNERAKSSNTHAQVSRPVAKRPPAAKQSVSHLYSIVSEDTLGSQKRSLAVRLRERVTESVLNIIARELYTPGFDRTFITYNLPGEEIGNGAWATTHFNPTLKVVILGSKKGPNDQSMPKIGEGDKIVGSWHLDHSLISGPRFLVKTKKGKFILYSKWTTSEDFMTNDVTPKKVKAGTAYYPVDYEPGADYWVVSKKGILEVWVENRKIVAAQKM